MTYYETKVVDQEGRQIDSYVDDATTKSAALELARIAFRHDHPDKDPNKHEFHARLQGAGSSVPAYGLR